MLGPPGNPVPLLATGAGHDAGILAAAGVPTAMLFVRNPTGVSHSPAEHAERDDCLAGVEALTAVAAELAGDDASTRRLVVTGASPQTITVPAVATPLRARGP